MTDTDVLARAAKALREAHTGHHQGSGFTRARIMNTVHRERRRRVLRWAVFSPIASVLLVGSAWAQSTGKWPVIWKAVAAVFSAPPVTAPPAKPKQGASLGTPPERLDDSSAEAPPPEVVVPDAAQPDPPEPGTSATAPSEDGRRAERPRVKRRSSPRPSRRDLDAERAEPPAPPAREPEPERDRELSRFRAAHDLHFSGDRPREAIAAYGEYLREFPNGRFVPEARYNLALDQIKVGNDEAARAALLPFAAGKFGSYRQREARELLEALERKKTDSR